MVNFCCVVGCSNRSNREKNLSFFCIPTVLQHHGEQSHKLSKQRREKWISNINRSRWEPSKHSRVCSAHFIRGKPAYLHAVDNPDWAPTQQMGYNLFTTSSSLLQNDQKQERKRKAHDVVAATTLIELRQNLQPAADDMQQHEEQHPNKVHKECQTDMTSEDVFMLQERCKRLEMDNIALRTEVYDLREKCKSSGPSKRNFVDDGWRIA